MDYYLSTKHCTQENVDMFSYGILFSTLLCLYIYIYKILFIYRYFFLNHLTFLIGLLHIIAHSDFNKPQRSRFCSEAVYSEVQHGIRGLQKPDQE